MKLISPSHHNSDGEKFILVIYMNDLKKLIKRRDYCLSKLKEWQLALKDANNILKNTCSHVGTVVDETSTRGHDMDNGYGRWWKEPYFRCTVCDLFETGYSSNLEKILKNK